MVRKQLPREETERAGLESKCVSLDWSY